VGLQSGLGDHGLVVESGAVAPALAGEGRTTGAVTAAERRAVEDVLELFISSATRTASSAVLEEKVLSSPRVYVRKYQLLPSSGLSRDSDAGVTQVRLLALIAADKLRKDLCGLGLVRSEGVYGTPRLLISLKETGSGAGREVGRASDAMRRGLSSRGYEVEDFSDRQNARYQKTGTLEEALVAARAAAALVAVSGTAQAQALADERFFGLRPFRARVEARVFWAGTGGLVAHVDVEATAVDLATEAAAGKALEDAGQLAADQLAAEFSGRFRERSVLALGVVGFSELGGIRRFMADLRGLSGVAGAAVVALTPEMIRLEVFVEKLSPEELAALLMRLPGYSFNVRSVETDYRYVEIETTRGK